MEYKLDEKYVLHIFIVSDNLNPTQKSNHEPFAFQASMQTITPFRNKY